MKLNNNIKSVRYVRDYVLRMFFLDGYVAELDFAPLIQRERGPLASELRDMERFKLVAVENGTVTFPNGYDICPDVLRFYCEQGRILSREETDVAFAIYLKTAEEKNKPVFAVAETRATYNGQAEDKHGGGES